MQIESGGKMIFRYLSCRMQKPQTFVETDRFLLKEIVPDDAEWLFELDSDPEVHRYLGNRPVTDIRQCDSIIAHIRRQYEENGIGRWAVVRKSDRAFIGWCGLKLEEKVRTEGPYYDLGYRIIRKYWGMGVATETARASIEYGFNQLGLSAIHAAADIQNHASNHILKKIGMKWIETFHYKDTPCHWYGIRNPALVRS